MCEIIIYTSYDDKTKHGYNEFKTKENKNNEVVFTINHMSYEAVDVDDWAECQIVDAPLHITLELSAKAPLKDFYCSSYHHYT